MAQLAMAKIEKVEAVGDLNLKIKFKKQGVREIDLTGFIARLPQLRSLLDPNVFKKAKVIDWGAAIGWPGDLDVGASTLWRLALEQNPFGNVDFRHWQVTVKLSNNEAAEVLGCSLGTVKNYRTSAEIPTAVGIACRAMMHDPIVLAAHLRPRRPAGRPVMHAARRKAS
ncbi:MAG: DUF2442 domain-containing protein [Proteobacteria bacterium]|nr:DUF2442 domain-containing protein [Pseudomonadota bacterium]